MNVLETVVWHEKRAKGYPLYFKISQVGADKKSYVATGLFQAVPKVVKWNQTILTIFQRAQENIDFANERELPHKDAVELVRKGRKQQDKDLKVFLLRKQLAELEEESTKGLYEYVEGAMQTYYADRGKSTKQFKRSLQQFRNFQPQDIPIAQVDKKWVADFVSYKFREGSNHPGISDNLRGMNRMWNLAKEEHLVKGDNPFQLKHHGIHNVRQSDPEEHHVEDLQKFFDYEPSNMVRGSYREKIQRNIDLFKFQLAIGGHDYADIAALRWDNIKSGRLVFKRFKNRSRPAGGMKVSVKLFPIAKAIIERHGTKEEERIFGFIPHPSTDSYTERRKYVGKSLERISKNLRTAKFKTKSPRYIFNTLAAHEKVSRDVIMKIQGHKPKGMSSAYLEYIKTSFQDAEHLKVLNTLGLGEGNKQN